MNELKYQLTQFIFILLLGLGTYWALMNLDSGIFYGRDEIVNEDLSEETPDQIVNAVNNEVVLSDENNKEKTYSISEENTKIITKEFNTHVHQELINILTSLIDKKTIFSRGNNGEHITSIQKFLDIYFSEISVTIDKDFGPETENLVKKFQKTELNGGDGVVGPNTLGKMVEILKEKL